MCHGHAVKAFPAPAPAEPFDRTVAGFTWGDPAAEKTIAVLPDIYGCNPFYKGLSTLMAQKGARVHLVDTFYGLGDLPEATREAAFARRNKVDDKSFLDRFEQFCREEQVTGVVGFCLGGLYIFELARRGLSADLIGLYGFPQGLPNEDPIPVPFDYLPEVDQSFTMLVGRDDDSVGRDNIEKLEKMSPEVRAMTLKVYDGVGHNFLPLLDSDKQSERAIAEDARDRMLRTLL